MAKAIIYICADSATLNDPILSLIRPSHAPTGARLSLSIRFGAAG